MNRQKNWTGERLETTITGETMAEHLHRYAIALPFVTGKKVLDIACGEGYGTNLLAKHAAHITGIDIDGPATERATLKYKVPNLVFKKGSVLQIPAENNSFDIITCFETLEHLSSHDKMLAELKRVLIPGGLLLISTPEKSTYSDATGYQNIFHQKELYGQEFRQLLRHFFVHASFFRQFSATGSFIQPEEALSLNEFYTGDYHAVRQTPSPPAMYWIGMASDKEIPLTAGSFFYLQKSLTQLLYEETQGLKKTITYRAGNILLSPFKFIRSIFNK
jgi:ubiquinone/menaquinone biosynthesis C-methylase UbiE